MNIHPRLSSKPRHTGLVMAAMLALGVAACGKDEAAAPAAAPVPVTVVTLRTQPVTLIRELPGRAAASLVAEVRPQVSGIVKKRRFEEGGQVQAGEILYDLDDETYRADASSAKAALDRARVTVRAAELTAARSAELARIDAISAQDNENAMAALDQARADVSVAEAAYERARVQLGYAHITAPISGRIGKSAVTAGALVTANQAAPLATIHQLDPVFVDVTPTSVDLLQLRKAQAAGRLTTSRDYPIRILLEDGTEYEHTGRMSFADINVDPGTGSFSLRVVVPNPGQILLPGAYVRALLSPGRRQEGLLVPQRAVTRNARGETTVLLVNAANEVENRIIVVSNAVGDQWVVESGLAAGERVIVEGLQKVRPGAPVTPTEAAPAPARPGAEPSAEPAATAPEATSPASGA